MQRSSSLHRAGPVNLSECPEGVARLRPALSPCVLTVDPPLVALEEVEGQRVVGHSAGDELTQHLHRQDKGRKVRGHGDWKRKAPLPLPGQD